MHKIIKIVFGIIFLFYILSTPFQIYSSVSLLSERDYLRFVLTNQNIFQKLSDTIQSDYDTRTVLLTRILHNKPTAIIEGFSTGILKSLDPVFVFSLSSMSYMYENRGYFKILYPIESIPFFLSVVYAIWNWKKSRKTYRNILLFLFISLVLAGLFGPQPSPIVLIPFLCGIRIFIAYGVFKMAAGIWQKT